jgi:hypothetical protein
LVVGLGLGRLVGCEVGKCVGDSVGKVGEADGCADGLGVG